MTAAQGQAHPTRSLAGSARVPLAFLQRDRRIDTSYKAGFLMGLIGSLVTVLIFYVLGGAIGAAAPGLVSYGTGYFSFVILGLAVIQYMGSVVGRISGGVRRRRSPARWS